MALSVVKATEQIGLAEIKQQYDLTQSIYPMLTRTCSTLLCGKPLPQPIVCHRASYQQMSGGKSHCRLKVSQSETLEQSHYLETEQHSNNINMPALFLKFYRSLGYYKGRSSQDWMGWLSEDPQVKETPAQLNSNHE